MDNDGSLKIGVCHDRTLGNTVTLRVEHQRFKFTLHVQSRSKLDELIADLRKNCDLAWPIDQPGDRS